MGIRSILQADRQGAQDEIGTTLNKNLQISGKNFPEIIIYHEDCASCGNCGNSYSFSQVFWV